MRDGGVEGGGVRSVDPGSGFADDAAAFTFAPEAGFVALGDAELADGCFLSFGTFGFSIIGFA